MSPDQNDLVRIRVTDCDIGITGMKQAFKKSPNHTLT